MKIIEESITLTPIGQESTFTVRPSASNSGKFDVVKDGTETVAWNMPSREFAQRFANCMRLRAGWGI